MRIPPLFWKGIQAAAAAGLILCLVPACKPAVQPAGPANPAAAKTNTVTATPNLAAAEHVSVFNELMPPKGKDPFYPNSHRRDPVPIAPLRQAAAALLGIAAPGDRRQRPASFGYHQHNHSAGRGTRLGECA